MKSIYNILTQLQTDLATDLPALLTASGLTLLDNYVIGESRNAREKAICIYKDNTLHFESGATITLEPQTDGSCFVVLCASNGRSVLMSQHESTDAAIGALDMIVARFIQSGFVVLGAD